MEYLKPKITKLKNIDTKLKTYGINTTPGVPAVGITGLEQKLYINHLYTKYQGSYGIFKIKNNKIKKYK